MVSLAALVLLGLLWPVKGHDFFERLAPLFIDRLNEIRKILVPLPESTLKEAQYHLGSYYIPLDSETELCRNHSSILFESFLNNDMWALKMVDACSKIPSGVIDGNVMDLGGYEQCLNVEAPGELFRGKHCIVETKGILPDVIEEFNPKHPFLPALRMDIVFTVCVPSTCTARDVKTHMDVALNSVNATAIMEEINCSSALPIPFEIKDWFAVFVLAVIVILVILSTTYDNQCKEAVKSELLTSFSLNVNITQMLDTSTTGAALTCLNGLRVLAMAWVVVGHRMLHMLAFPTVRMKNIEEKIDTFHFAIIENTQLAVEIFFLMSGTLVTYSFLRYRQKSKHFNLAHFYLYRYFRLTPPFAVMILLHATLIIRWTDGPLWIRSFSYLRDNCQNNWWSSLLYISNYANPFHLCMTQTWFLSSDFQLYFFSPIILIPLHKRPKVGLALTALFLVLTTVGSFWNAISQELKAGGVITIDRRTDQNNAKDYIVTHIRAASFLYGVAFGYLLFKIKQGQLVIKLSKATLWAGWLVATFLILFSVFFIKVFNDPDYVYIPWVDVPYLVLHRHMLTLGIMWIILVCTLGHGGVVDRFLSWNGLIPLARLTYCNYLTHVLVQTMQGFSQRAPGNISYNIMWYYFFADFTIAYLIAALLFLTVEAPCVNIMNLIFQGKKKTEEAPQSNTELPVLKY